MWVVAAIAIFVLAAIVQSLRKAFVLQRGVTGYSADILARFRREIWGGREPKFSEYLTPNDADIAWRARHALLLAALIAFAYATASLAYGALLSGSAAGPNSAIEEDTDVGSGSREFGFALDGEALIGVEVKAVRSGSLARRIGLSPGDQVLSLNGRGVASMTDWRMLRDQLAGVPVEDASAVVRRDGVTVEIRATAEEP